MRVIACDSPYGQGGMGQHFAHLVEESRQEETLKCYYTRSPKPSDAMGRTVESPLWKKWLLKYTPVRFSQGWTHYLVNEFFDRQVANRLTETADRYMGFVGQSLHSFRKARRLGFERLELATATAHVRALERLHNKAHEQFGGGQSWLNAAQVRKAVREYEMADVIYVHSDYTRDSFIDAGISPDKLERTYLSVDARFTPPSALPEDDVFRVVYVGRIEFTKGIHLLFEAFDQLPITKKKLILVGGWSNREMRKYTERWLRRNPEIKISPGDPLPVLHKADVLVHPTYQDGFGYAPMEALACGVPVIVTEDTGMKEYVREGINGYIIPTGDAEALYERLLHLSHTPMKRTQSDPPFLPRDHAEEASPV